MRPLSLLERAIEARLGGYRQVLVAPDPGAPRRLAGPRARAPRVCVVGGGIAGITAALHLGERGFRVELREAAAHLGGKLGAWRTTLPDGREVAVEHGFHAFFRHYYNLDELLERVGARRGFRPVSDYRILTERGDFGFRDVLTAPVLNLLTLPRAGLMRLSDVLREPRMQRLRVMLEYDPERTFRAHDGTSFAELADAAGLPPELRLVFSSFSRAFFSDPREMSLAELVKSFHFYFLGHDRGLLFDYPTDDHERALLAPLRAALAASEVEIRTSSPVSRLVPTGEGFSVDGEPFDGVVLACDVVGARAIAEASPELVAAHPELAGALAGLRASGRYAVWRIFTDRDTPRELPDFVVTDRRRALDSISLYHRIGGDAADFHRRTGGGVYELHSYHLPADLRDDAAIRAALLDDLFVFLPELRGLSIVGEHLRVGSDFTSFGVGQHAARPATTTGAARLVLAGDWVKLPCPAMLMEAACTSGLLAESALAATWGLGPTRVWTIPPRGLLAPRSRAPEARRPAFSGA